jgi:hypothetical protein
MTADGNSRALRVENVLFTPEMPEYPISSENGTAHIIDVSSMNEEKRSFIEDGVCKVF